MEYDIQFTNNKPAIRFATGYTVRVDNLLAKGDSNTKLAKSAGMGFLTRGLSLAPHQSTMGNVCPHASPGCIAACLFGQGRAAAWNRTDMLSPIAYARIARNLLWHLERDWFLDRLHRELNNLERLAIMREMIACCRLNMFSDIPWERFGVVQEHPDTVFYDYSKWPTRYGLMADNYWVTFSRSEINQDIALNVLADAGNVAVVFADSRFKSPRQAKKWTLPSRWHGYQVLDGDSTDLRFTDTRGRKHGRVIGLKLKSARTAGWHDAVNSGFPVLVN
jgi:hypothetical protein